MFCCIWVGAGLEWINGIFFFQIDTMNLPLEWSLLWVCCILSFQAAPRISNPVTDNERGHLSLVTYMHSWIHFIPCIHFPKRFSSLELCVRCRRSHAHFVFNEPNLLLRSGMSEEAQSNLQIPHKKGLSQDWKSEPHSCEPNM